MRRLAALWPDNGPGIPDHAAALQRTSRHPGPTVYIGARRGAAPATWSPGALIDWPVHGAWSRPGTGYRSILRTPDRSHALASRMDKAAVSERRLPHVVGSTAQQSIRPTGAKPARSLARLDDEPAVCWRRITRRARDVASRVCQAMSARARGPRRSRGIGKCARSSLTRMPSSSRPAQVASAGRH